MKALLPCVLTVFAVSAAMPVLADACRDEIVALYDGGPLDPFVQPPYRYETQVLDGDGALKFEYITTFDTPMRSMNGLKGQTMHLSIGLETWSGPSPDGPWTPTTNSLPENLEEFFKTNRDNLAANTTEPECLGTVTVEGQDYIAYRCRTQTGPNPDSTYFGGRYTSYIDPASNRLMRHEWHEPIAHYLPQPGTDVWIQVYTYDDSFALSAPE